MSERGLRHLEELLAVAHRTRELLPQVEATGEALCRILASGGRLYAFGNGGSAAESQHFAAELVGRFRRNRRPLAAFALTADPSILTCIGNDFSFEDLFARQVEAVVRPGDGVLGITTSGSSENVIRGLKAARARGAVTVALTGETGCRVAGLADHLLAVPSSETARIQEMHLFIIHLLCEIIDEWAQEALGIDG